MGRRSHGERRRPGRGQGLCAAEESAARGNGQEDRGHRILLLWLPALPRPRADPADLDAEASAGRAVSPRARDVPATLGGAGQDLLHPRRHG